MPQETDAQDVSMPEDQADFERWRETGKLPEKESKQETPAESAGAETKTAPDSGPEKKEEPKAEDEPVPPGVQKRIDKAVAKQREAERRAAEAEQRLQALQGSRPAEKNAQPAAAAETGTTDAEPDPDKFDKYEDYIKALTKWSLEQTRKAEAKQADDTRAAGERQQALEAWGQRVEAAKAEYADFDEVIESVDIPLPAPLIEALMDSEHGARIGYQLAKTPAELERISKLSPLAMIREVGKLETRFTTQKAPEPKPKPSAPEPITPVKGGKAPVAGDDDSLSYDEWERRRNASLRRR